MWRRRVDYPALKIAVQTLARQWNARRVLVEDAGAGTSLVQELKGRVSGIIAVRADGDKASRMAVASESGQALLPERAPWLADLEAELFVFPGSRHDDQSDSISQALLDKNNSFMTWLSPEDWDVELRLHCIPGRNAYCPAIAAASESALHRRGSATQAAPMPSWIADSGLCLLAQKTSYVARHIRLRSRALSGSFARLLGAGTARSLIQIDGSLIPKRGIGQHAVDTALALDDDNGFDRSVRRLSMPFLFRCQFIAHCSHLSANRRDRDFSTPSLNFAQDHRPRKVSPQHRVTALAARTGDPGVLLAAPSGNGKGNAESSYRMIVNSASFASSSVISST